MSIIGYVLDHAWGIAGTIILFGFALGVARDFWRGR